MAKVMLLGPTTTKSGAVEYYFLWKDFLYNHYLLWYNRPTESSNLKRTQVGAGKLPRLRHFSLLLRKCMTEARMIFVSSSVALVVRIQKLFLRKRRMRISVWNARGCFRWSKLAATLADFKARGTWLLLLTCGRTVSSSVVELLRRYIKHK